MTTVLIGSTLPTLRTSNWQRRIDGKTGADCVTGVSEAGTVVSSMNGRVEGRLSWRTHGCLGACSRELIVHARDGYDAQEPQGAAESGRGPPAIRSNRSTARDAVGAGTGGTRVTVLGAWSSAVTRPTTSRGQQSSDNTAAVSAVLTRTIAAVTGTAKAIVRDAVDDVRKVMWHGLGTGQRAERDADKQ